jgi:hypothetical protein
MRKFSMKATTASLLQRPPLHAEPNVGTRPSNLRLRRRIVIAWAILTHEHPCNKAALCGEIKKTQNFPGPLAGLYGNNIIRFIWILA